MIGIARGFAVPWKGLGLMFVCFAVLVAGAASGQSRGPGDEHLPPVGPRDPCALPPGGLAGALDPGAPGPFTVSTAHYSLGTESFVPLPGEAGVEEIGYVHFPSNLNCGPYPMVFIMHGSHATCFDEHEQNVISQEWPCPPEDTILPNYRGYDYLAERLASHGFVVVSISANAINANYGAGIWDEARARLFQHHMDLWQAYATVGGPDLGGQFIGKVNLQRVGTLGHSRGGQAAVLQVGLNESLGSPYGIQAVFTIGATRDTDIATGVPIGLLLPYCDGDQDDLPSVGYFDDARYAVPGDPGAKFTFLVDGANHNYYNTYWDEHIFTPGAKDDWTDGFADRDTYCSLGAGNNGRLTSVEQRGTAIALASAFFRAHIRNERSFLPFLRGDTSPPPSAMTDRIYVGYLPGDEVETRLDVNRLTGSGNTATNSLGGLASHANLLRFEWCDPSGCLENIDVTPAFGRSGREPHVDAAQLRIAWSGNSGVFANELPEGVRDVSGYRAVQFRAFIDTTDALNVPDQPQDLSIELEDGAGQVASVRAGDHSRSLYYPPSHDDPLLADSAIPRAVLNTVRVPLAAFDDVFLTDIRAVRLRFDQTPTGAINIADLAFADETLDPTPTVACTVATSTLTASGSKLEAVGLDVAASDNKGVPAVAVAVFSDEDDTDSQPSQNSPDARDIAPGTLRLRGEADKDADGRVYVVVATATDAGGNTGFGCCTVTVPNGSQQDAADAVAAQAEAATGQCTSFAAAAEGLLSVPDGYFVVGDGPVIGQDQ